MDENDINISLFKTISTCKVVIMFKQTDCLVKGMN